MYFYTNLSCEAANCLINLTLSSEGFGSLLAFIDRVFGFFQQFCWPFLVFFLLKVRPFLKK